MNNACQVRVDTRLAHHSTAKLSHDALPNSGTSIGYLDLDFLSLSNAAILISVAWKFSHRASTIIGSDLFYLRRNIVDFWYESNVPNHKHDPPCLTLA